MRIIDLHCDTIARLAQMEQGNLASSALSVDLDKLERGGSMAQFFALFVDLRLAGGEPFAYAMKLARRFQREMKENALRIGLAVSAEDLAAHQATGKIAAFLTLEEGGVFEGKIENLRAFYRQGVRLVTLSWNYPNELGFPNAGYIHQRRGLTAFGRSCVEEMERLGMIVDVSHLSDQGFYDVAAIAAKPFVASHSNSRFVTAHARNLSDDMIRVLAEKGGVAGLNFAAYFLGARSCSAVEDMVRHILHIRQIGGSDVVALGSDFDGIDCAVEIQDFSAMQTLAAALRRAGISEADLEKIFYKNALRVIQDCMKSTPRESR